MPAPPINTFTVGTELQQLIITCPALTFPLTQIGQVKHFSAQQQQTTLQVIPVTGGGSPVNRNIYHGWNGRLQFARFDGAITAMVLGIMQNFQLNSIETYSTISLNIYNAMLGSVDVQTFNFCVFDSAHFGDFEGTKEVDQEFNFRASSLTYTQGSSLATMAAFANAAPASVLLGQSIQ